MAIEVVKDISAFRGLGAEWDRLAENFRTPLLRHRWFLSAAEAFHRDGELRITLLRRDGRLIAAAPLSLERRPGGGPRLRLLGVSRLHEPSGLLYSDDRSLEHLVLALYRQGTPVVLQRVAEDAPEGVQVRALRGLRGFSAARTGSPSLYIPIQSDWESYFGSLPSRRRQDMRRARRRALRRGEVKTRIFCPGEGEFKSLLDLAFNVEAAGWKGRVSSSLLHRDDLGDFFRRYAARACSEGTLRLAFLTVGERTAAMQISLESDRRFWVLKTGYDESFGDCSPGSQLMMETVRYAHEKGLEAFEFLGSEEGWLTVWTDRRRRHATHVIYPTSMRGMTALAGDAARFAASRLTPSRKT